MTALCASSWLQVLHGDFAMMPLAIARGWTSHVTQSDIGLTVLAATPTFFQQTLWGASS
jgi:hypothetical protein